MALYTAQTLENLPGDEDAYRAQLQGVQQRLGLTLDPAQVQLPVAQLKRAQMLEYEQIPIAQINYLDPRHGPLALCITRSKTGMRALAQEVRHGMNVGFWSGPVYAYLLIGRNSVAELKDMADIGSPAEPGAGVPTSYSPGHWLPPEERLESSRSSSISKEVPCPRLSTCRP